MMDINFWKLLGVKKSGEKQRLVLKIGSSYNKYIVADCFKHYFRDDKWIEVNNTGDV